MAWLSKTFYGLACNGEVWESMAWFSLLLHEVAFDGMAGQCTRYDMTIFGMIWYVTAVRMDEARLTRVY